MILTMMMEKKTPTFSPFAVSTLQYWQGKKRRRSPKLKRTSYLVGINITKLMNELGRTDERAGHFTKPALFHQEKLQGKGPEIVQNRGHAVPEFPEEGK